MTIAYTDFWSDFDSQTLPLTNRIKNVVPNIKEVDDIMESDFLLFSCLGEKHWMAPDNCVKIFYTGENITPDFNACDYAIGFDWLDFGDRYLRFPLYYLYGDICDKMEKKHINIPEKLDRQFCSVTISNTNRNSIFKELFDKLSSYKKVDSGGQWSNNVGGPVKDKFSFDLNHKFSLVCENTSYPGYTTEKIVQAFAANCIPIYWGDPAIGKVFNKDAFVNVLDYSSIDGVIEKVKEIDNDDCLFMKMQRTPALLGDEYTKEKQFANLDAFFANIFKNPVAQAKRRNRDCWGRSYISTRQSLYFEKEDIPYGLKLKMLINGMLHR